MAERVGVQGKGAQRPTHRKAIWPSILVAVLLTGVIACRPSEPGNSSVASGATANAADEEQNQLDQSESDETTMTLADSATTLVQPLSDSTSESVETAPEVLPKRQARREPESPFEITKLDTESHSEAVPAGVETVEPLAYDPNHQTIEIPETWKRLSKQHEIWLDTQAKQVIVAGEVCLDRGQLEMFICPRNTKEHESVISVNALASEVHASLISLKADPGKPTSWDPEYRAAFGPVIEITLMWRDAETKKTRSQSAHQWVRNVRTGKALAHPWVFGGSRIWVDPDSGTSYYNGDGGELICLSNFETATIDLNIESSQSGESLLFEAFTENIPPVGTKVYAILKPGKRIEPKSNKKEKQAGKKTDDPPIDVNRPDK